MDLVVIGAGSVGGYFGARLQQAGESVTFLVRPHRRDILLKDGLRVRSSIGNATLSVKAETDVDDIMHCDVVMVTVRNFDLDAVMDKILHLTSRGASVISLLNGVEHLEKIRRIVPDDKIIGGSAYIDSRLGTSGEIIHRSQQPTIALGKIRGSSPTVLQKVSSALSNAGIETRIMDDLLVGLWQKYLFVMLGSFTAVASAPIGTVLANRWCTSTLSFLMNEFRSVAKSIGVDLENRHAEAAMSELKRQHDEWTSLVYEDLLNHRRTEIDSLWGYMVRKAEESSVDTPLSVACYGILKIRETMYQKVA